MSLLTNGIAISPPAHCVAIASCVMSTPFDVPVVPLVYMTTATSPGAGGVGSHAACAPAATSSSIGVVVTPSSAAASTSSAPIVTTNCRPAHFSAARASVLKSLASHTHVVALVWLSAVATPSSPSVAYAVTTSAPCRQHANAATIQSRCVSA